MTSLEDALRGGIGAASAHTEPARAPALRAHLAHELRPEDVLAVHREAGLVHPAVALLASPPSPPSPSSPPPCVLSPSPSLPSRRAPSSASTPTVPPQPRLVGSDTSLGCQDPGIRELRAGETQPGPGAASARRAEALLRPGAREARPTVTVRDDGAPAAPVTAGARGEKAGLAASDDSLRARRAAGVRSFDSPSARRSAGVTACDPLERQRGVKAPPGQAPRGMRTSGATARRRSMRSALGGATGARLERRNVDGATTHTAPETRPSMARTPTCLRARSPLVRPGPQNLPAP